MCVRTDTIAEAFEHGGMRKTCKARCTPFSISRVTLANSHPSSNTKLITIGCVVPQTHISSAHCATCMCVCGCVSEHVRDIIIIVVACCGVGDGGVDGPLERKLPTIVTRDALAPVGLFLICFVCALVVDVDVHG